MPEVLKLLSFVICKYSDLSEEFSALKTTQNGPNFIFFLFFSIFVTFCQFSGNFFHSGGQRRGLCKKIEKKM